MSQATSNDNETVIPPSSLFVFWPGREPPMAEEIRVRLADWGQPAPDAEGVEAEETLWSLWFEVAGRPTTYLLWCEPVCQPHKALLESVQWRSRRQKEEAAACHWVVGLEGAISLRQPTADYQFQLKLCDAIAGDCAPVIFDASALRFRTPQELRYLTETKTPPRTGSLYNVHKLRCGGEPGEPCYWVHTHGLERAGVPDLELFDVPAPLVTSACELIEAVADLWIEFQTPDPQTPFAVGRDLEIAWRPWQAAVAERPPHSVGGWDYRQQEHGHGGYRAVLVAGQRQGWVRKRWNPPVNVLRRLTQSDTTLYKTTAETKRMSRLARERWGTFGLLFAGRHPEDWRFAVKLCYPMEDDPRHGEHLWFDVNGIRPGRIFATLVSTPSLLRNLEVGKAGWHELDRLSDWRILTPQRAYDPETADTLLEEEVTLTL